MGDERFLVVRLGSLGDIVHTFPAVAGLRESFPNSCIVWLTHPRWVDLVASSGLATEIWPVDSRDNSLVREVLSKIRKRRWAAALDYQGLWKSAFLPFLGGISNRIGFSSETIREFGVQILYNQRVRCVTTHIADQNGELTLRAGARAGVTKPTLSVSEADGQKVRAELLADGVERYVVLSPGGGWRSKCWPAERYGALARRICSGLDLRSVINYGPGEETLAADVKAASGDAKAVVYDGELGALMALLRGSEIIVGGDTGPLHLALALGTRGVAIYGPTDPARNGPYPPQQIVLRKPGAITSHKRISETDPSLLEISVDEVFEAVRQRLGAPA
jgi:heptosyltransferase-1